MVLEVEETEPTEVGPRTLVAVLVEDAAVLSGTRTAQAPVRALAGAVLAALDIVDRWEAKSDGLPAHVGKAVLNMADDLRNAIIGELAKG